MKNVPATCAGFVVLLALLLPGRASSQEDAVTQFSGEPAEFGPRVDHALNLLSEDKQPESRGELLRLQQEARTETSRQSLTGLVTATFFDQGAHQEGLEYICDRYRLEPPSSVRYRHAIQAHIRVFAVRNGMEAADRLVRQLRTRCGRSDFSPLWIGIELEAMRLLENSRTYIYDSTKRAPSERVDADWLRHILNEEPAAPFSDYGWYFLGEFDRVLAEWPRSMIRDTVLLAAAQTSSTSNSIRYYQQYLIEFPTGPRIEDVLEELVESYIKTGRLHEAAETRKRLSTLRDPDSDPDYVAQGFFAESSFELVTKLEAADFDAALAEYVKTREALAAAELPIPESLQTSMVVLRNLVARRSSKAPDDQFRLATDLRDWGDSVRFEGIDHPDRLGLSGLQPEFSYYSASSSILDELAEQWPENELAPRAIYIAGSNLKKRGQYAEGSQYFERLAARYPRSHLVDDALAEVGYYHMISNNWPLAESKLLAVATEYSDSNGADNALNWVAIHYLDEEDYPTAGYYYGRVAANVVSNRLRRIATEQVALIRNYLLGAERGWHIHGASLSWKPEEWSGAAGVRVSGIQPGGQAERNRLIEGDVIRAVDGREVTSLFRLQSFVSAPEQTSFRLTVQRRIADVSVILQSDTLAALRVSETSYGTYRVSVTEVPEGSSLFIAGLRVGDAIAGANGEATKTVAELQSVLDRSSLGNTLVLTVIHQVPVDTEITYDR